MDEPRESIALRIKYEAYSNFSSDLLGAASVDEIRECLYQHLKYLIDYGVFRMRVQLEDVQHAFIVRKSGTQARKLSDLPMTYEREVHENGLPFSRLAGEIEAVAPNEESYEAGDRLWCWCFLKGHEADCVVTTILSEGSLTYKRSDVVFIQLVSQAVLAKLREVSLLKRLEALTVQQAEIIAQRTRELKASNTRLADLLVSYSHNIREPLTRIMGLIDVMGPESGATDQADFLTHIRTAGTDLDEAIRQQVKRAEFTLDQE